MQVTITHCNNIEHVSLSIEPNKVNVLYGVNGTGKSTIADVINTSSNGQSLTQFTPYGSTKRPAAKLNDIGSVFAFNERYLNESLYLDDGQLIRNGKEVFIETSGFMQARNRAQAMLGQTSEKFLHNEPLESLVTLLDTFLSSFGANPHTKKIAKTSSVMRSSMAKDGIIENIPAEFERFSPYIHSNNAQEWITWHGKGSNLVQKSACPYCGEPVTESDTEMLRRLDSAYGAKIFEHTSKVNEAFNDIRTCFSPDAQRDMDHLLQQPLYQLEGGFETLERLRHDALYLRGKLNAMRCLGFNYLWQHGIVTQDDLGRIDEYLRELIIDMKKCPSFGTREINSLVDELNDCVMQLIGSYDNLRACVGRQRSELKRAMAVGERFVDTFLDCAGFPYKVTISYKGEDDCSIRLLPKEGKGEEDTVPDHLSYGERNALAVALFAAHAKSRSDDLIIMDDPISSFDGNKRYALLHRLFGKEGALCGRTVLFLTHDYQTILLFGKIHHDHLTNHTIRFISNDLGLLCLEEIRSRDLQSFVSLCKCKMVPSNALVTRLVFARRLEELKNGKSCTWNYLSSLLHKLEHPSMKISHSNCIEMTEEQKREAERGLLDIGLTGLDYGIALAELRDDALMIQNYRQLQSPYEKLGLVRVLYGGNESAQHAMDRLGIDEIVRDYITGFYHAESETLFQLDPTKYWTVPRYVTDKCDELVDFLAGQELTGESSK